MERDPTGDPPGGDPPHPLRLEASAFLFEVKEKCTRLKSSKKFQVRSRCVQLSDFFVLPRWVRRILLRPAQLSSAQLSSGRKSPTAEHIWSAPGGRRLFPAAGARCLISLQRGGAPPSPPPQGGGSPVGTLSNHVHADADRRDWLMKPSKCFDGWLHWARKGQSATGSTMGTIC